ncbi:piezo-type mechanosensitive ion channel component 1 isoform X4 [Diceros bicornis minor]|uniref:piezo-type mechanosensitive ion channel component 1 isoform X4 n=1 Tax=Diceros bicornis minor TaxID=77932 RepID=UPI0026ECF627|nr:piezo-type mechanosensitive ion channel component 1 isoform X4 [Diceros bicornis minor]
MEPHVLGALLYWLLLPFALLAACLLRFNALSLVYLLFLLLLPWLPGPSRHSLRGHTGRLLRALLVFSLLFLVAHVAFQICLHTVPHLDQLLGPSCSPWETLSRHIGVTRLDLKDIPNAVRLVGPDLGIVVVSSVCLGLCRRLTRETRQSQHARELDDDEREVDTGYAAGLWGAPALAPKQRSRLAARFRITAHWLLVAAGRTLAIVLLALAGIAHPSAFSSVYFLLFLAICTWWACHFPISPLGFSALCVMVGCFGAGHLICLYCYQTPFAQALLPPTSIWARVFGLKDFVAPTNCSSPSVLVLNTSHDWPVYVSPGILLLLCYTVTSLLKLRTCQPLDQRKEVAGGDKEREVELTEMDQWPQGQARAVATKEEGVAQRMVPTPTGPDSEADNCIVHDLTSHSPVQQRPLYPRLAEPQETSPLHGLGHLIMDQSYVCALIAMMVWSITYHSWLTFVLLLWACLIWTVRSRHQLATLCSPFILLYGLVLCGLRYVWAMDLRPELPTTLGPVSLRQLGLEHTRYPCLDLGAMLLCTLTFWLLLRQFVKEKLLQRAGAPPVLTEVTVADTEPTRTRTLLRSLGRLVTGLYAKYWIYVCAGMFVVVSFAGRLVVYKIVYMFLFLLCLTLFQFQDFPTYWRNLTGFTDEQLGDLGLEQFSVSELFSSILVPGFFLLACILQLHYFHQPFMQLTDLEHARHPRPHPAHRQDAVSRTPLLEQEEEEEAPREEGQSTAGPPQATQVPEATANKWGLVAERLLDLATGFSDILTRAQVFVGRLLELHVFKLVALYTVWVALKEVSVMNLLLVVLWAFALPYPRFRPMASCLSTVWTCIIIVCKMLYQLKVVRPHEYSSNCTEPLPNSTNLQKAEIHQSLLYRGPVDPANWFGVRKGFPNLGYIQNHLQILLLLVFEAVVYRRQEYHRRQHQLAPLPAQAVCADGTRQRLDKDLLSCLKYFINFFFYKFGLEICFLMAVNVIGQRMNFMVILHGCWLVAILTRRRRGTIARLWPNYCLFLALFLLYQYMLCLGIPPALCIDYPWRWSQAIPMNSALIKWLYLPDFFRAPNSTNLISDFLLLLCASQQWQVFSAERTEEWQRMAGVNTDHLEPLRGEPNPVPNFIHCRSYLDVLKVAVFRYLFWLVLVVVFVTGATRISIFGLGYLLACFYLLLFGTALLQKDTHARLVLWDCLILYNVTVIVSKNMLSLLSCVFVEQMQSSFCWVIQLFSLACTVKGYYDPREMLSRDQDCLLPVEEAGVLWDSVCFLFLLLQRRVFLSHYFLHVRAELQATALLASRGFALYNAANLKSIDLHRKAEEKSLAQLKRQMERIRAKQEKHRQGRSHLQNPPDPGQEPGPGSPGGSSPPRRQWWRPWLDHATVIHSGDYFLFESDSEEEEEEAQPEDPRPSAQSAFQMAYQAWVTNAQTVLRRQREERAQQEQGGQLPLGGGPGQEAEPVEDPEDEVAGHSHVMQRVLSTMQFLWVLGQALVDGLTRWLHTFTRHHSAMSDVLRAERYLLAQELLRGGEVHRGLLDQLYTSEAEAAPRGSSEARDAPSTASSGLGAEEPLSSMTDTSSPLSTGYNTRSSSEELVTESRAALRGSLELPSNARTWTRTASELLLHRCLPIPELEEAERFTEGQGRVLRLLQAVYQCVAAHSELLCYFIIVLNHMVTASAASLVLPVLVFLWAMLSIPRPSKRFWMTAIIFTEVTVVTKYLFQFGFFPWNSHTVLRRHENKPYFPPRILGLEKSDSYIKCDLVQLLALFFHRSQLLCYGLWDHEEEPLPEEHDRGGGKKWAEEEPALLGPQTEAGTGPQKEPGVAAAPTEDDIQVAVRDGPPESPVDLKPHDKRRVTLRFRRRRKENAEPRGLAATEAEDGDQEEEKEAAATGREKRRSRPQERVRAAGLWLQSFCLSLAQSMYRPLRRFFHDILHTKYRAATDVYALMFLADVVDFIIIIFGFWAFGKHSAARDITSSLSDDQVPEAFLVMLLIQFSTMVVDRALYLRKTVLGKLAFQVVLVLAIHLWMFFILPAVTERMFSQNAVAQLWYFVKCIYFALSAYQIRCGYPTRILGNFLTKKYNHLNLFLFQGFRLVPFLVELRAVMDWVWTDTTLSLSNWMCVEDIYANIFIIKCSRETEKKYPQPKGQKKKKIVKYGMGGLIILFLVAIIWFPLLFMSLVRSVVGVVNQPIDVTVTLKLGGYEPLFTMSAQQPSIVPFTHHAYEALSRQFDPHPLAMQFISQYSPEDIVTAQIEGSSGALWRISPPSRAQMKRELYNGTTDITLRFTWNFQRDLAKGGNVEYTNEKHTLDLAPNSTARRQLASLLEGTSDQSVVIPNLFPKYIRAPNGPEANPVKQLQPSECGQGCCGVGAGAGPQPYKRVMASDGLLAWTQTRRLTTSVCASSCGGNVWARGPLASSSGGSLSCRTARPTATYYPWSSSVTRSARPAWASWPATGSWGSTCPLCWSSASSCAASSVRSHTPSCSRSCRAWTASSSCARTSSWCGRRGSWS